MSKLYFGDNLDILRNFVADESVDLIYLDPPFNSNVQYNVLFKTPETDKSSAQAGAFRDTWSWDRKAEEAYTDVMKLGGSTARMVDSLRQALGEIDLMAYITMMAVRFIELHRVLKSSGALYLHCDPTASHYLKIILDSIFGLENFRSEIIWRRSGSHNSVTRQFGPIHDCILFFSKTKIHRLRPIYLPHTRSYIQSEFRFVDRLGGYRLNEIMGPGVRSGDSGKAWHGYDPSQGSRHWAVPDSLKQMLNDAGRSMALHEQLDALLELKQIHLSKSGRPKYKQRPTQGVALQDIWAYQPGTDGVLWETIFGIDSDVKWLSNEEEKIGYPTQKPVGLLERILRSSSDPDSVILDPFCGCGTTVYAAEKMRREWIGIDIAVHAVKVIENRMAKYAEGAEFKLEGIPKDFASAVRLARNDKYQFQWWANYLFNPHALREQKKGADRGVDGELFFPNGPGRPWGKMLTSVKGGENLAPSMVRDFGRVIEREKAELGLFICLGLPTQAMLKEAATCGFADVTHGKIPKLQIVSLEEFFEGRLPLLPPIERIPSASFVGKITKRRKIDPAQPELPLSFAGGKGDKVARFFNPTMVSGVA